MIAFSVRLAYHETKLGRSSFPSPTRSKSKRQLTNTITHSYRRFYSIISYFSTLWAYWTIINYFAHKRKLLRVNISCHWAIRFQLDIIGHFRIAFSLFLKASLGAHPFIWKWDFIHKQIKLIFIWMVVHQSSLSWRGFDKLGNGLFWSSVTCGSQSPKSTSVPSNQTQGLFCTVLCFNLSQSTREGCFKSYSWRCCFPLYCGCWPDAHFSSHTFSLQYAPLQVCWQTHTLLHYVQLLSIFGAVGLFRSDMLLISSMVWSWFSCGTVCVCPQFPYRGNDTMFWIFRIVPCHAFCMWHWPIGKDLDLSFIWGHHHLHIVCLWISVNQLRTSKLALSCCCPVKRST